METNKNIEWKYKVIIFFAVSTIGIVPIVTSITVPRDSNLPVIATGIVVLFWALVLAGFILKFLIGDFSGQSKMIKEIEALIAERGKEALDYNMFKDEYRLFTALSILMSGDSGSLKKLQTKKIFTASKLGGWFIVFILLIPISAIGFLNPFWIVFWLGLFFIYLVYVYFRNIILDDEYLLESRAFGLVLDKREKKAEGRGVTVYFMGYANETDVKGNVGVFSVKVEDKNFVVEGKPVKGAEEVFEELSRSGLAKFWKNVDIQSDGRKIKITRKGKFDSSLVTKENWYMDVWLGEHIVDRCK